VQSFTSCSEAFGGWHSTGVLASAVAFAPRPAHVTTPAVARLPAVARQTASMLHGCGSFRVRVPVSVARRIRCLSLVSRLVPWCPVRRVRPAARGPSRAAARRQPPQCSIVVVTTTTMCHRGGNQGGRGGPGRHQEPHGHHPARDQATHRRRATSTPYRCRFDSVNAPSKSLPAAAGTQRTDDRHTTGITRLASRTLTTEEPPPCHRAVAAGSAPT
jgi:hypothetical protein